MKTEEIKTKYIIEINRLIEVGQNLTNLLKNPVTIYQLSDTINELFSQLSVGSKSLLIKIYGSNSIHLTEFQNKVKDPYPDQISLGVGILKNTLYDLENEQIISIQELVSQDFFSDFLEMASYLLSKQYKDPAAVLIGGVLEQKLKKLAEKSNIPTKDEKGNFIKAEALNGQLYTSKIITISNNKDITSWLNLRNDAAHGAYENYKEFQVVNMLSGVTEFLRST